MQREEFRPCSAAGRVDKAEFSMQWDEWRVTSLDFGVQRAESREQSSVPGLFWTDWHIGESDGKLVILRGEGKVGILTL